MDRILERASELGKMLPEDYAWILQVFIIILAALIIHFFVNHFFDKAATRFKKSNSVWNDFLLDAARKPVSIFIWLQGLLLALNVVNLNSTLEMAEFIGATRRSVVIVLFAWFIVRFISGMEQRLTCPNTFKKPLDLTTAKAMGKLLKAATFITAALVLLQTLGFSVSGVLAFGGIGGIAIGFAARDLLANFFGAIMIYLDRPFSVGDWIRSPDRNIEGTVEDIGWRLTRIRTFDQRPLYVPNAIFANISVENPSRMYNRRINETIGLRYEDIAKVPVIIERVRQYLIDHQDIETESRTLIVNFNTYGPSTLDFFIYTFTKTTNWVDFHGIKQTVLLGIYEIINDEGAEIAFPTQTLHLVEDSKASGLEQVALNER